MFGIHLKKEVVLILLAVLSLLQYLCYYFIIGNLRDTFLGFLSNLAFLPVYVIFVTLILEQNMKEREFQTIKNKLNMVIGVFFSEVGNRLLRELSDCVVIRENLRKHLGVNDKWKDVDFQQALSFLRENEPDIDSEEFDKQKLKDFMISKRTFMVGLLENQNLLEHEQFTELLWAVFHLLEELEFRKSFAALSENDIIHINNDIKRAFGYLSREWVYYMKHLKQDYPYLFSLAVRTNPMLDNPDPHFY